MPQDFSFDHSDIKESEELLRLVLDATSDGAWDWNIADGIVLYTDQWVARHGYVRAQVPPRGGGGLKFWESIVHPDDKSAVLAARAAHLHGETDTFEMEYRIRLGSGEWSWTRDRGRVVAWAPDGSPLRMVGTNKNIDDRIVAQLRLVKSEELNRSIVENSDDCIKLLDLEGRIIFMNGRGLQVMEIDGFANVEGKLWAAFWPDDMQEVINKALVNAASAPQRFSGVCPTAKGQHRWWHVTISLIRTEAGQSERILVISKDVTQEHDFMAQLQKGAYYDAVTDLPNRRHFNIKLNGHITQAEHEGAQLGLMILDIDNFKQIIDTLGYHAGDILLKEFGERLQDNIRKSDMAARLSEDEFAVIMPDLTTNEIIAASESLSVRLQAPFVYEGHLVDCSASIGFSICPDHGTNSRDLIRHAGLALSAARSIRSGAPKIFEPEMLTLAQSKQGMLGLARDALRADRISPHYQPKIDLSSGQLDGFEALLRWRQPRGGIQLPAAISAAFQDVELAIQISDRMFDRVISDVRIWLDQGLDFGHIGVNAAAADFRRDDFAERVLDQLRQANVPPQTIELEVTESVFLGRGSNYVERALKLLSVEGVRIALDDFGTGYASLTHLKRFPVDVIKIDQSFVRGLEINPDDTAIVKSVLGLGKSLDIAIVAEGIETPVQAAYLWAQGCQYGQGYLFGKAMPASRIPQFIASVPRKRWRSGGLAMQSTITDQDTAASP